VGLDAGLVIWLNRSVRRSAGLETLVGVVSEQLAGVEVGLMVLLAISGRPRSAARMLLAVTAVYGATECIGWLGPRRRPFERLTDIQALRGHRPGRSFPSRHVASGLAMAAIGSREHRRLGRLMAAVAWVLGLSRVAAGMHYPSDVLAGAALGRLVAACLAQSAQSASRTRL
jgi:undecaprenyl-diphosphatase